MKVSSLMRPRTFTCSVDATLGDAAAIMEEHACGIVPIVENHTRRLLGVVTDRDIGLCAKAHKRALDLISVRAAFSWQLVTCTENDDALDACRRMGENGLHRLPVTNRRGVLVGLVSLDDIAQAACRTAGDEGVVVREVVTRTLAAIGKQIEKRQGPQSTALIAFCGAEA